MRTVISALATFAIAAVSMLPASGAAPQASPGATKLAAMNWLAGGTWTANLPQADAGRIDVRYESVADGALLRFQSAFVTPAGTTTDRYAGHFYFDPVTPGLKMWYVSSENQITTGTVTVDGNITTIDLVQTADDGKAQPARVVVAKRDDTHCDWTLYAPDGPAWKKLFTLTYTRTPDH